MVICMTENDSRPPFHAARLLKAVHGRKSVEPTVILGKGERLSTVSLVGRPCQTAARDVA